MSDSSRQGTPGLPRLSHADAETLISARSDAPLPHEQNRILLAHLATCPSCRAFADQVQSMSQALRDLPMLPASPTVSRQVRERISVQPSPWARLAGWMFSGPWGVMPAAAAALLLVAAATFYTILQGGDPNEGREVAAPQMTETALMETGTATTGPTRIATQAAEPSRTPRVSTQEADQPAFTNIQVTFTPTSEPTETATAEPSATATDEPTETATAEPSATATSEPTETPEPTETATAEPTETSTSEPTSTRTPTAEPTETTEPTETPTDEPTETPTLEPTETDTPKPTATKTPRPTRTPTATSTATETPTDEPTETPTEGPPVQPTIAPANNGTGQDEPVGEPTEEPGVGGGPDETAPADETPDNVQIVQVDEGTETPDIGDEPTAETTAETTEEPTQEPTEEPSQEPTPENATTLATSPLAEADVLGELGPGVGAPAGGLAVPPDGGVQVVVDGSGGLAVVDANGSVSASLGAAALPIWSPQGEVLLYSDLNTGSPFVAMWDRTDGQFYRAGAEVEEAVADYPAGWIGSQLYYLRTYLDGSGRAELHSTAWNGSEDVLLWSGEGIQLTGERPIAVADGVLIPTADAWLFVDTAGTQSDRGANPYGVVGEGELSLGGTLLVYPAGGELVLAPVESPGSPQATVPYDGVSGFALSPDGFQLVVADGGSLTIYATADGSLVASATDDSGATVTAPSWGEDGIRYLEVADTTRLKLVRPEAFA